MTSNKSPFSNSSSLSELDSERGEQTANERRTAFTKIYKTLQSARSVRGTIRKSNDRRKDFTMNNLQEQETLCETLWGIYLKAEQLYEKADAIQGKSSLVDVFGKPNPNYHTTKKAWYDACKLMSQAHQAHLAAVYEYHRIKNSLNPEYIRMKNWIASRKQQPSVITKPVIKTENKVYSLFQFLFAEGAA